MKPEKLVHIGIVVSDLDGTLRIFEEKFGLGCAMRRELPEHGIEIAKIPIGELDLEFIRPLSAGSSIQKFLDKKGPGLHHLCFGVDNVTKWIKRLEESGVEMVDRIPRSGADGRSIAFIHPKSTGGILIELEEE